MEKVSENQLGREFQEQYRTFCTYIFTHAKTKTLRQGITVTGNGESSLLQHVPLWFSVCDCTLGLLAVVAFSL